MKVYVKDWFFEKEINYAYYEEGKGKRFYNWGAEIVRETEKAYLLKIPCRYEYSSCDMFYVNVWCPKSCAILVKDDTDESMTEDVSATAQVTVEAPKKTTPAWLEKYNALLNFAKENKVKGVRNGMKAQTILRKIRENGLVYEY